MFLLFIFQLLHQPLYQLALFLLATLLLAPLLGLKSANAMWNTAGVLYIGFILTNAVFLWFSDGTWAYFFISLACSLVYIAGAGMLVSLLIRVLKIHGSGESAMIFLSVIYHPVVLLLVALVKWMIGAV